MELDTYINARFPTFKSLDQLETEQRLLNDEVSSLQQQLESNKASFKEVQKQKLKELEHMLTRFAEQGSDFRSRSSLILQLKESAGEVHGLLDYLPADNGLGGGATTTANLHDKLLDIKNMVDLRGVIKNLADLEQLDKTDLEGSYHSAVEIERNLHEYTTSDWTVVRSLAQKGLQVLNDSFRTHLNQAKLANLRDFLKLADWPKPIKDISKFSAVFSECLKTESPTYVDNKSSEDNGEPHVLKSFSVLAEAFDLRFQYFFESKNQVNRLDKPEWVFNYVVEFLDTRLEFFKNHVQPLLIAAENINGTNRIALHEFITAILPSIYRKFTHSFPRLAESPAILSHTVYELLNFDNLIKTQYYYVPYGNADDKWSGLTSHILSQQDYFSLWLNLEKDASMKRYSEILEAPNAWDIEWDAVDPSQTKPTVSAILIVDMLEGITDRYDKLGSVFYRLKFLGDIQVTILDNYYNKLRDSVDAYESMNSSLARAVGGLSNENIKLVTGIQGLERLSKLYGSLVYIEKTLGKWGQDIFFVELWEAISRVNKNKLPKNNKVNLPDNEDDEGTLFDETIQLYAELRQRVIMNIDNLVKKELQQSMKDYFKFSDWSPDLPAVASIESLTISGQLNQPIKVFSQFLPYLAKFHTPNDNLRFKKDISQNIKKYIYNYIVQANTFNQYGGQQLTKDVSEFWASLSLPLDSSYYFMRDVCLLLSCDPSNARRSVLELKHDLKITLSIDDIRNIIRRRRDL